MTPCRGARIGLGHLIDSALYKLRGGKMDKMGLNESLMIASTLLGPILAVQAQKWVERARTSGDRRDWIFTTLMATRQTRLSTEHVRALNLIDLAYYGTRWPFTDRSGVETVIRRYLPPGMTIWSTCRQPFRHNSPLLTLNSGIGTLAKTNCSQICSTDSPQRIGIDLVDHS